MASNGTEIAFPPEAAASEAAVTGKKLWEHPSPQDTEMYKFKAHIAHKYKQEFSGEEDVSNSLWKWSVENIPEFWGGGMG
jgi:hypothetical protein